MPKDIDPQTILADLFNYVEQYRLASVAMPNGAETLYPRVLIRGLLVELALKAYLAACGVYREGHDLVALLDEAAIHGLTVDPDLRRNVVENLNQFHDHHDDLNWQYLSRYPVPNRGTLVSITPSAD